MSKGKSKAQREFDLYQFSQESGKKDYKSLIHVHKSLHHKINAYSEKINKLNEDKNKLPAKIIDKQLNNKIKNIQRTCKDQSIKFDELSADATREKKFTYLVKLLELAIDAKNVQCKEITIKEQKRRKIKDQIKALKLELKSAIEAPEVDKKRDEIDRELDRNPESVNIAAATFIIHSSNPNLPNSFINIKIIDREISSLSQTRMSNLRLEQLCRVVGPIGKSTVNIMLYGHSEQDIIRSVMNQIDKFKEKVQEVVGKNTSDYRATFVLASRYDTCCVCSRSILSFVNELSNEVDIQFGSSVSFLKNYYDKDMKSTLGVISRIKALSQGEIAALIISKFNEYGVGIDEEHAISMIPRVVEMGISFFDSDASNAIKDVDDVKKIEVTVLNREISNGSNGSDMTDDEIEIAKCDLDFHKLNTDTNKVDFSAIDFDVIKKNLGNVPIKDFVEECQKYLLYKDHRHDRPILDQEEYGNVFPIDKSKLKEDESLRLVRKKGGLAGKAANVNQEDVANYAAEEKDNNDLEPTTPLKETKKPFGSPGSHASVGFITQDQTPDNKNIKMRAGKTPYSSKNGKSKMAQNDVSFKVLLSDSEGENYRRSDYIKSSSSSEGSLIGIDQDLLSKFQDRYIVPAPSTVGLSTSTASSFSGLSTARSGGNPRRLLFDTDTDHGHDEDKDASLLDGADTTQTGSDPSPSASSEISSISLNNSDDLHSSSYGSQENVSSRDESPAGSSKKIDSLFSNETQPSPSAQSPKAKRAESSTQKDDPSQGK
jgi:hypothetical protein